MADKKLEISIVGGQTETTKNQLIQNVGIPKGAATVVRDSNGKVIQVLIKLPESAAAAATAALLATPGVSDVVVADILPGQSGLDGTADGKALLISQGYSQVDSNGTMTVVYSSDNTSTFTTSDAIARTDYNKIGSAIPAAPLGMTFEVRMKCLGTGPATIDLSFANGFYSGDLMSIYNSATGINTYDNYGPTQADTAVTNDELFHTYKAVLDPSGLATVTKDNVLVHTLQFGAFPTDTGNFAFLITFVSSSTTIVLDYARWTQA